MDKRIRKGTLLCSVIGFLLSCFVPAAFAASISLSPINPEFLEDRASFPVGASAFSRSIRTPSGEVVRPGRRPSPLNFEHLRRSSPATLGHAAAALPERYDLRTLNKVPPVRDQGVYGACWTFGALVALESLLLPGEARDFSEWHLGYWTYVSNPDGHPAFTPRSAPDDPFDPEDPAKVYDQGGDDWKAISVLARGTGPVNEADLPYGGPLPSTKPNLPREKLLTGAIYMPYGTTEIRERGYPHLVADEVKDALTRYGVLSIGMMADFDESTWNRETSAFYYSGVRGANHAVNVVGWDDLFPKESFSTTPPGDGAWIVRNSWGSAFGENGYFYISYYDTSLDSGIAYIVSPPERYDILHQHDPLGWVRSMRSSETTPETGWMANVFTTEEEQTLRAVSFYAASYGTEYEISVVALSAGGASSVEGKTSLLRAFSGTLEKPGYHTIPLSRPISLAKDVSFRTQVKLTTPGYGYPLPVESPLSGYSDSATASPGESFYSADGLSWSDLTEMLPDANFCLKVFATAGAERSGGSSGCSAASASPFLLIFALPLLVLLRRR